MVRKYLVASVIAAACFAASSVSAAIIDFDELNAWTDGALSFSNGSETVNVSAATVGADHSASGHAYVRSITGGGLGVCTGNVSGFKCSGDDHLADGSGQAEMFILDFGDLYVKLNGMLLTYLDDDDEYAVFTFGNDKSAEPTAISVGNSLPDGKWWSWTSGFDVPAASVFGIVALGEKDNFGLKHIGFDVLEKPEIAAAPIPAAGLMLVAGLGGLAALRRRRKA